MPRRLLYSVVFLFLAWTVAEAVVHEGMGRQLLERGYPTRYPVASDVNPFFTFNCAAAGRFPFMASIKDRTLARNHICGGILVAENAVLTAAHCVDPRATRNAVVFPEVHLGGTNLRDTIEVLQTVAAIPHPKWTGDLRDGHDLVLLKLEKRSCLTPIAQLGHTEPLGEAAYGFFGYGRGSQAGAFSRILQSSPTDYVASEKCRRRHGVDLRDNELCFSAEGTINVCKGDDGGPLLVTPTEVFALYEELVAIPSYATGDCEEEGVGIFMNVAAFRDWIDETLDSEEFRAA